MPMYRNNTRSDDGGPVVIAATSLKSAHRRVRARFGDDAAIIDTRTMNRRQDGGLGHRRTVEILVAPPGMPPGRAAWPRDPSEAAIGDADSATAVPPELVSEVERIEGLVEAVVDEYRRLPECDRWLARNPSARNLLSGGAGPEAVRRLLTRFGSETGSPLDDRDALRTWLTVRLAAADCGWEELKGCHAFLGDSACGRSDMVLAAAIRLREAGRKPLVLAALPDHGGQVSRLQEVASAHGFDAAVVKRESRLAACEQHLDTYDAVLLDLPRLEHPALTPGGEVHGWLAGNATFHRHLLVPLDRDLKDAAEIREGARSWNCDWLALSRLDRTGRPGKILDLLEIVPLPVSLLGADPMAGGQLDIAAPSTLAALVLNARTAPAAARDDVAEL